MPKVSVRTGFGFDSHLFGRSGTLILGGVTFPGTPALAGHSDGDAVVHAVIDALLGAAVMGDIGDMFPDTSKKLKGISSQILLVRALERIRKAGWKPAHIDITILADKPKLGLRKIAMARALSKVLNLSASAISVKAKTQEGLKLFSSPGGIAVWALATISK